MSEKLKVKVNVVNVSSYLYVHAFYLVLFCFSDSATSSHLGVIPYSDVFEVILNCLQYVSNISPFIQSILMATVFCTRQSGVKP